MMNTRAVLDANVFVSGLITPQGFSGRILKSLQIDDAFELVLSKAILEELERTLNYPKVRKHLKLSDPEIRQTLAAIEFIADLVPGVAISPVKISDKDDIKYLTAAMEGRVAYLVSGDSDLLCLGEYEGISIVTPKVFFELLQSAVGRNF